MIKKWELMNKWFLILMVFIFFYSCNQVNTDPVESMLKNDEVSKFLESNPNNTFVIIDLPKFFLSEIFNNRYETGYLIGPNYKGMYQSNHLVHKYEESLKSIYYLKNNEIDSIYKEDETTSAIHNSIMNDSCIFNGNIVTSHELLFLFKAIMVIESNNGYYINYRPDTVLLPKMRESLQYIPPDEEIERFDKFFEKFAHDTFFQKIRTILPLKIFNLSDGEIVRESKVIPSFSFDDKSLGGKVLLEVHKRGPKKVSLLLQVEDTGIYIEFYFVLNRKKWYLQSIRDSST